MAIINGLSFPLKINSRGGFSQSVGVEKIKENIKALILTSVGDRVMNPSIGTLGYMYLFRNMSFEERSLLETQIASSIERVETRVVITEVNIFDVSEKGELKIVVEFRVDQYEDNYDVSVILEL